MVRVEKETEVKEATMVRFTRVSCEINMQCARMDLLWLRVKALKGETIWLVQPRFTFYRQLICFEYVKNDFPVFVIVLNVTIIVSVVFDSIHPVSCNCINCFYTDFIT